jgi:hypothetical protein
MKAMFFLLSMQSYSPYFVFVCDKAVCGSSMWHFRWGVPSRMTGERGRFLKREEDCVEDSVKAKDSCSWILGSSGACPRMTGEKGDGFYHKERNVKAKDYLFVLDCFVPRNDGRGEGVFF